MLSKSSSMSRLQHLETEIFKKIDDLEEKEEIMKVHKIQLDVLVKQVQLLEKERDQWKTKAFELTLPRNEKVENPSFTPKFSQRETEKIRRRKQTQEQQQPSKENEDIKKRQQDDEEEDKYNDTFEQREKDLLQKIHNLETYRDRKIAVREEVLQKQKERETLRQALSKVNSDTQKCIEETQMLKKKIKEMSEENQELETIVHHSEVVALRSRPAALKQFDKDFQLKHTLPETEFAIDKFKCMYNGKPGVLYITPHFLVFEGTLGTISILSDQTPSLKIPISDIVSVRKVGKGLKAAAEIRSKKDVWIFKSIFNRKVALTTLVNQAESIGVEIQTFRENSPETFDMRHSARPSSERFMNYLWSTSNPSPPSPSSPLSSTTNSNNARASVAFDQSISQETKSSPLFNSNVSGTKSVRF